MADPAQIPTLGRERRARFLESSNRTRAAFVAEADASMHAGSSKSTIRASEGEDCDIAALTGVTNVENVPDNPTDRSQVFKKRYQGKMLRNAVLMDIKSFQFRKYRNETRQWSQHVCLASITLTPTQAKKCQAIILVSLLDPEWIAVIPRPYLANNSTTAAGIVVRLGASVSPAIARVCPLPAEMAPFIMPISFLGQAMDNFAASASSAEVSVYNPFTGVTYKRCTSWRPKLSYFDDLLPPADATEFKLREQIQNAFKAHGQGTNLTVRTPLCAPLTSDLKLEHTSGTSIFIEIKVGAVWIRDGPNDTVILEHSPTTRPGKKGCIFGFMASWDYLFSVPPHSPDYALMIKKDDWPDFWHRMPDPGRRSLSFEYPDSKFVDAHKVRLKAGQKALVQDICKIVLSQGVPQKATLTATEIIRDAGPCPISMFTAYEAAQEREHAEESNGEEEEEEEEEEDYDDEVEEDDDVVVDDDIVDDEEERDDGEEDDEGDAGPGDAMAENPADGSSTQNAYKGRGFVTRSAGGRVKIQGGRELVRLTQLFTHLMEESRHMGEGCPIFLGAWHPEGNIGFVPYTWSEADKRAFDEEGRAPCWVGNLPNETAMVALMPYSSRWRFEYAPDEGTPGEIEALQMARSCLLVSNNFTKEIAHRKQYVWLIPSEYMPKVSVRTLKGAGKKGKNFRPPIFLKNKVSVDNFILENPRLYTTLLEFISGRDNVTIGRGAVVILPSRYLKTVGEYRHSTDANLELCFKKTNVYNPLD